MNVPNILTAIRFMFIPVFAYYLSAADYDHREYYFVAVFMFLLAGLTDVLDGYIARKFNLITSWGKLADPLADKLMQLTALMILAFKHLIPGVLLAIVVIKEIFMGIGGIVLYKQENYVVSANWYGKMATVVFYFAIIMVIFKAPFYNVFFYVAVLATLFAFAMYIRTYQDIKKQIKAASEKKA